VQLIGYLKYDVAALGTVSTDKPVLNISEVIVRLLLASPEPLLREGLEKLRWDAGVQCPECGSTSPIYKQSRNGEVGYYRCPALHRVRTVYQGLENRLAECFDISLEHNSLSDLDYLSEQETDDDYGTENDPIIKASYRPYGPHGYYVLPGLEEIDAPLKPFVFSVRYNSMLMGSKVPYASWLAFLILLKNDATVSSIASRLRLTRKTVIRMRKVAIGHVKYFRRNNLFILRMLASVEYDVERMLER